METPPANDNDDWQAQEEANAAAGPSTEQVFEGEPVPTPSEMVTARSVAVSVVLGATLSIVAMKLSLTSGYLPHLTIPAGLMGFFLPRWWVRLLNGCGVAQLPFTRQENALIQTFVVACSNIAYTGGFGSYILAMSRSSAENGGVEDGARNVEEPYIGRLVAFLFLASFASTFAVMPFRNSLIIRHHLTFPTGTATAHLINSMHTPHGAKQASKQVSVMFKTFGGTLAWSLWQWFFTGGEGCGLQSFPIFGLAAAQNGFFFDCSMTNIGVGLFSPYNITISMLVGSIISFGVLLPYVTTKAGIWYPHGNEGAYGMFIGITMVLADGLFHLLCILHRTLRAMHKRRHSQQAAQPFMSLGVEDRPPARSFDDRRRAQVFLRDRVFDPAAVAGYIALSVASIVLIPHLYPQLRPIHVAVAYLTAPAFAFCNAYGTGITDVSVAPTYGRIAMLAFGWWVGLENGGLVAGLAAGVILMSAVSTASDLMQVFRTGYHTLTSPHAVLISQIVGTAFGCVINPLIFWMLYGVYNGGDGAPDASYAKMYRGMTILALSQQGLPRHGMLLCKISFMMVLANNVLREVSSRRRWRVGRYLPCTIAVAVAFFLPPEIPIGMFMGSIVMYLWRRLDPDDARARSPAMAAGLICGDGVGTLLRSMLLVSRTRPPMCIMFLSSSVNTRLDAFLATIPTSS
ncbi:putative metal-nicotianamine transporter YSL7 [Dichanthelium oligosanthes]|uniref:Putative metal-nicotianamine transporter YSL7 n=1 Tax=Dichanthelium oligosanthes TaxID=888268 RepID=A0A1E5UZW0_9POAL|nr:putative metal-nicotianamine transporter YSL7 [Dichanthelium oligosanthes]